MLKINRDLEFLKKLESLNSDKWSKNPLKDLSFPHAKEKPVRATKRSVIQGWYSQAPGLLFHACRSCILKLLEITAAVNYSSVLAILSRTCYFVNSQWITSEENCLDKIYFDLNGRTGRRCGDLLGVCSQCQTMLCLSIIHKEFNCLDKYFILTKKWTP